MNNPKIDNKVKFLIGVCLIFFVLEINPFLGLVLLCIILLLVKKHRKRLLIFISSNISIDKEKEKNKNYTDKDNIQNTEDPSVLELYDEQIIELNQQIRLQKRKKYLHVALNNTIDQALDVISQLPVSDRILIEVGTPLIKVYGVEAVKEIKNKAPIGSYIVADNKCSDLAMREVQMMAEAGASAATCLGVAPIETINTFINECDRYNIDSIIDMMNVENPLFVLKKLQKLPTVVMLHRGVDESEFSKEKQIPYYQIKQIKGSFDVMVAVAGGDTAKEVKRAIFNDADIVVVWKNFYQKNSDTAELAKSFLQEVK